MIERDELCVHYQPIYDLGTGAIAGFEALVRWNHWERGLVPPADFIGIAEETGQIDAIGRWVLRKAVSDLGAWRAATGHEDLWVAVNLSGRQLRDPELISMVREALATAHLEGPALKLEITESMLLEDTDRAARTLEQLGSLGVQLYMDDFGTGYASLGYLHRLPLQGLKIDRSFVSVMHTDARTAVLVERIVALAKALGLSTVAEGIELPEHDEALRALGCDYAQGFLYSRPLPGEHVLPLLGGVVAP